MLIVDAQPALRLGLRQYLEGLPDLVPVATGSTLDEALSRTTHPVDLVVLGLAAEPHDRALAALQQALSALPHAPVVVYGDRCDPPRASAFVRAGARGYVPKDAPLADLVGALRTVVNGDTSVPPDVLQALLRSLSQRPDGEALRAADRLGRLTAQERATLALIAQGMATDRIARELGIGRKTAQTHRRNVQRKLGLSSTSELVHVATTLKAQTGPSEG